MQSDTKERSLTRHKFELYLHCDESFEAFQDYKHGQLFLYLVEVYVDNSMSLIIPTTREQMMHVTTAFMTGIHDVFPEVIDDDNNPILLKKMKQGESQLFMQKIFLVLISMERQRQFGPTQKQKTQ